MSALIPFRVLAGSAACILFMLLIDHGHGQAANTTATPEELARQLVSRMRLDQKVRQLNTDAPAIPELSLPAFNYWSEGIHGYVSLNRTGATIFPVPLAMGATFDAQLVKEVATAISDEVRAYNNLEYAQTGGPRGLNLFAPNINILRDPRWGRANEVYSEDPMMTGRMAAAFVQGLQGDDPNYLKAVATCKHFAGYSVEGADGFSRHNFNAMISRRDLLETYLPAFEACVKIGKAASVMCSYNAVNSIPSCANVGLLNNTLRRSWGFNGFVVSDCGAITDVYQTHKFQSTVETAISATTTAGTDLNCDDASAGLISAVVQGLISETVITNALVRVLTARFRLGGRNQPWSDLTMATVGSTAHTDKAHEAARKSFVLLKNDAPQVGLPPLLPLDNSTINRIAVIGPLANDTEAMLGSYYGVPAGRGANVTPLMALMKALGPRRVVYAPGASDIINVPGDNVYSVTQVAATADVAIVFVGSSSKQQRQGQPTKMWTEGEGLDRMSLRLPGIQEQLVRATARAGVPVVLVLINGGPVDISPLLSLPNLNSVLVGWYPGQGAEVLADVILGKSSPGGRLPVTFYYDNYTSQIEMSDMDMRKPPGRTYRYLQVPVLYPFGHGLSYATFQYQYISGDAVAPTNGEPEDRNAYKLTFNVTNTGLFTGDEVVLVYLFRNDSASLRAGLPRKQLLDFQRVSLRPTEFAILSFASTRTSDFTYVDARGTRRLWPGDVYIQIGQNDPLIVKIEVENVEGVQSWDVGNYTDGRLDVVQQGFPEIAAPPPPPGDVAGGPSNAALALNVAGSWSTLVGLLLGLLFLLGCNNI